MRRYAVAEQVPDIIMRLRRATVLREAQTSSVHNIGKRAAARRLRFI